MYLEDAIGSDDSSFNHIAILAAFLSRLRPHNLKLPPNKTRSEPSESTSWPVISQHGVRPNEDIVAALSRMPMPADIKQLRSLLGGLGTGFCLR